VLGGEGGLDGVVVVAAALLCVAGRLIADEFEWLMVRLWQLLLLLLLTWAC
jgi:hypothetical protein